MLARSTSPPVGAVGGINSPEQVEQAIAEGKIDFAVFGRQMLADPNFAQKCMDGDEARIRRCLRCYKCFPGSPEEGYDEPALHQRTVGTVCWAIAPSTPPLHPPFDIDQLPAAGKGSARC